MSLHYLKKPPYAPAFPWDSPVPALPGLSVPQPRVPLLGEGPPDGP